MATSSTKKKTSFQRKTSKNVIKISGTKPSIYNSLLLTSTGVPSFDAIIGGGIAVGTVLMIEEDLYSSYSNVLLKYFLAEGVLSNHKLFVASFTTEPSILLKNLPGPASTVNNPDGFRHVSDLPMDSGGDALKIAWQYKGLPTVQSCANISQYGHYYDLSTTMDYGKIQQSQPQIFSFVESDGVVPIYPYEKLLKAIYTHIQSQHLSTNDALTKQSTVLRIAIQSLHSPVWCAQLVDSKSDIDAFCRFLYRLRAILRYSLATCVLTVPTHLFQDLASVVRIERLVDTVVKLDSFNEYKHKVNPIFKDYQGTFHIVKTSALNSLIEKRPSTTDYGFKLRRKKFTIETMHLPPELPETTNHSHETAPTLCSRMQNKLDF